MKTGAHLLKDWIGRRGYKQTEAAHVLSLQPTFLSMLVNEHRMPSLNNAIKIERVTGIPVEAWESSNDDELPATGTDGHRKRLRHR